MSKLKLLPFQEIIFKNTNHMNKVAFYLDM